MAVDETKARELRQLGLPWLVANKLADPANDTISGGAVTDAAAMTAPSQMGATYTQANVNALQADVTALRTKVNELLAALRTAGVIS